MAIRHIEFNGVSTKDLGLVIQGAQQYDVSARDYETIHVPGRNGDLVVDKGSFANVTIDYTFGMIFTKLGNGVFPWNNNATANALKNSNDFNTRVKAIGKWLSNAKGYCTLKDSADDTIYRKAYISADNVLPNIYNQATTFQLSFNCKPQKYLVSGLTRINWSNGVVNTVYKADYNCSPIIYVDAGAAGISNLKVIVETTAATPVNLLTIEIGTTTSEEITIDWNNSTFINENGNNISNLVTLKVGDTVIHKLPDLPTNTEFRIKTVKNSSVVIYSGGVTPNWWSIW